MRGYRNILLISLMFLFLAYLPNIPTAQYWFQSGVRGSNSAAFNNGVSASIQTIYQNVSGGSFGFWVGEDLSNGAFVQIGYEISNVSGDFPQNCSPSGCANYTYIQAGVPTWFWEYFPSGYSGSSFYGGIGVNASAGKNGTFNTYSFSSSGNTWNFYFNGNIVGSIDLGTSSSGPNPPTAFAEYADTLSNSAYMHPVKFRNLEFMQDGNFKLVPKGYSYVGYGKGSNEQLSNPYGVAEVDNYVDYFEAGSGLPILPNYTQLWELGYSLTIKSTYANISSINSYLAYSKANISAPAVVYLSKTERVVFEGWQGNGQGSYSGNSTNATVYMGSNITETALWQKQYFLNATTPYGSLTGGGWYDSGTYAAINVSQKIVPVAAGVRAVFKGWSDGSTNQNTTLYIGAPSNITAEWQLQYLINSTSQYGKVTGTGWYDANSIATIGINITNVTTGPRSRMSFYGWTNGNRNSSFSIKASAPIFLTATFVPQYLVDFVTEDEYGNPITVQYLNIDGTNITNESYIDSNKTYSISYAEYKGVQLSSNYRFSVSSPQTIYVKLPVYNLVMHASSVFGTPINATVYANFKNGTAATYHLGNNGTITIYDVPYGYVQATFSYFGISQNEFAENGMPLNITMFTPSLLFIIIAGILIIFAVGKISAVIKSKGAKASKHNQ